MANVSPVEGTLYQREGLPPKDELPTQYDLPSEHPEEPGLPDEFHIYQPQLLRETFRPQTERPDWLFIGSDINLYYDPEHPLWHKRPDWFVVLGTPPATQLDELRYSYVVWQEELTPYLVVELLSPGTEDEDLGRRLWDLDKTPAKWVVYEQILKIPYYLVYSRITRELQAFGRVASRYRPISLPDQRLWLPEANLGIGLWDGRYAGCEGRWLRCYDAEGRWLPTLAEQRDAETARAEQAEQAAEQERRRAERLAARLEAMGVAPDADEGT
jgi:Uma2 family endonuclease